MLRAGGQSSDVVRAELIEAQWHEMSQALPRETNSIGTAGRSY